MRRAFRIGSTLSMIPRTISRSTDSMSVRRASSFSFVSFDNSTKLSVLVMYRLKSTDIRCISQASAGPRSLEQPLKNCSVFISPVPPSSSVSKSISKSFGGMSKSCILPLTVGFFSALRSSSRSSMPPPSVSASSKTTFKDSITFACIFWSSLASLSSLLVALISVVSTTTPTIMFNKPIVAMHMKGTIMTKIHGYTSKTGRIKDDDHLSKVMIWKSEYADFGTVPKYASLSHSDAE
mmetsp:Transcript_16715/g.27030  ORF Transcript_16715/g.27030 Transcript_16715/m.27030 type:complete len:237 (+) Transcript_16715:378-1088(+)